MTTARSDVHVLIGVNHFFTSHAWEQLNLQKALLPKVSKHRRLTSGTFFSFFCTWHAKQNHKFFCPFSLSGEERLLANQNLFCNSLQQLLAEGGAVANAELRLQIKIA